MCKSFEPTMPKGRKFWSCNGEISNNLELSRLDISSGSKNAQKTYKSTKAESVDSHTLCSLLINAKCMETVPLNLAFVFLFHAIDRVLVLVSLFYLNSFDKQLRKMQLHLCHISFKCHQED